MNNVHLPSVNIFWTCSCIFQIDDGRNQTVKRFQTLKRNTAILFQNISVYTITNNILCYYLNL